MVSLSYPHINSSNVKSPLTPSWKPNKKTDPIAQVKPILRKGKQRMYNKCFFERMYKKFLIDWKASWGAEQDCNCKSARAKAREAKVEVGSQMEENEGGGGGTGTETYSHIWWALASAAQLVWAISSNHMKLQHKPFSSRTAKEYWSLLKLCVFFFVVHLTWLNMLSAYLLVLKQSSMFLFQNSYDRKLD